MHDLLNKQYEISNKASPTGSAGLVDFNATGDKLFLHYPFPIQVTRWGIIAAGTALAPVSTGLIMSLDLRPTIGSDTNRVTASGGTLQRTSTETLAVGKSAYIDVTLPVAQTTGNDGKSLINVDPAGPLLIGVGQEGVIQVSAAAGAAGTGYVWVEYIRLPFNKSDANTVLDV